jgi:hypothetical protein
MEFHCKTCGGNLRYGVCGICRPKGVFIKGDLVRITDAGRRVYSFETYQVMRVAKYDYCDCHPYVTFMVCPSCRADCTGHYIYGLREPSKPINFELVTS